MTPARSRAARRATLGIIAVGIGLVLAPVAFRMFERAPKGGTMLDDFRPYMTEGTIADFRGYLDTIGAAARESSDEILPALAAHDPAPAAALNGLDHWISQWPAIDTEMRDMLDDMDGTLDNFRAVDALPPFPLFPWFFVAPGVLAAALGIIALRSTRPHRLHVALALVGIGLVAAPAIFQMFSRAPLGEEMIDTFRPLMTREKVTSVQTHFLVIGNGEADLRRHVLPVLAELEGAGDAPDARDFVTAWPEISREMAPMIGAMADNLENYAAVDALPPFSLFPWFFVAPGIIVFGLALVARRATSSTDRSPEARSAP